MPELTIVIPVLIIVIYALSSIKILAEYERAVIFTPRPRAARATGTRS